jgi:hypothetical protein
VADARVELLRARRRDEVGLVTVEVEPACWRRYIGPSGARELVRPDLYLVTSAGDFEDCWFVEIDRGTESSTAITRKCRAYTSYYRTGREQEQHGAFPLVLWVTPDEKRSNRVETAIASARNLTRDLFKVTTAERFVQVIKGGAS